MALHGYNNEHFNSYRITRFKYRTNIFFYNVGLNKITGIYLLFFAWKFCYELIVQNLALKGGF